MLEFWTIRGLRTAPNRRTLNGPHRTDFSVLHGPKSTPAELCSTGEQKALLIGLILAQARAAKEMFWGQPPSCFWTKWRRISTKTAGAVSLQALDALGTQAWMTGTEWNYLQRPGPQPARFLK